MKILITGATGFVGSHLAVELLNKGYEVHCLARRKKNDGILPVDNLKFNFTSFDKIETLDDDYLRQFDYIYHFAGLTKHYDKNEYYKVNFEYTKRFVDKVITLSSKKLKRFVFCSSQAAAGPSENSIPIIESDLCNPINSYGKSKLQAEKYLLSLKDKINFIIIRPPAVFGQAERDIYTYFKMIKNNLIIYAGTGDLRFSAVYVKDLVRAAVITAEEERIKSGEIFFIVYNESYSVKEFALLIAQVMNKKTFCFGLPLIIVKALGLINEYLSVCLKKTMLLNKEKLKELQKKYWLCSNKKFIDEFQDFEFTNIKKALTETYNWYKENNWL